MNVKQNLLRLKYLVSFTMVFILTSSSLNAQNLDFEIKNEPLKVVLKQITDQTGYNFVYSDALTVINKRVSVVAKNEEPEKFFKRFFPTIGVIYKIHGKQVSLSSGEIIKQDKKTKKSQKNSKFEIKGTITDVKGEPLVGVSVLNMSNKTGTYTDLDGCYSLEVEVGDLISFTFIGFKRQEHTITKEFTSKNNVFNLVMEEDAIALESVAVIGYGNTQKIKDITGSISHIGSKELEVAPMASTIQSALQGRAAGVNVQIQSASPTSPVSIIIRGQSSISGNNQPLWVIDGIPEYNAGVSGDISNVLYSLNLNDVESIDILKDASSTAIYGSRASNGVIVVTTKSGKEGLKPTLEFTSRLGAEFIDFNDYDYFDTPQYIEFTKLWTRKVLGVTGSVSGEHDYIDLEAFRSLNTSEIDPRKFVELPDAYYDENNYWLGEMTQTPIQQQYDLTLRGGTKEVSYLTSLFYNGREGVVKTGSSDIYGGKIRLEARIRDNLKFRINANASTRTAYDKDYMIEIFRRIRPDLPKYNPDGTIFTLSAYVENPLTTYYNTKKSTGESFSGISELEWTIMDGLIFSTRASVNYSNSEKLDYYRRGSEHNSSGERFWSRSKSDTKVWDNTLVYANKFGKHDISASLTSSMERYQRLYYDMEASNFPDDDVLNSFTDATDIDGIGENYIENSLISQIGRIQYKYADKYLATFTLRRDGSSKFGPGKRWGIFPSGGVGWLLSEEEFMKKGWLGDNVTHMKLRASYGKSGSQNLSDYQWMTMVSSDVYNESPAIYPSNIGNINLQWEETFMTDVALELEMWDSRFRTTVGYFSKKSDNLIYRQNLPYSSAFTYMYSNIASTEGHGFEFNVDVDIIKNADWQLTLNANGSKNKSKIVRFNNELTEYYPSHSKISLEDGGVIGNWYGYRSYNRLFGTSEEAVALKTRDEEGNVVKYINTLEGAGDIYIEDLNGDGVIDTNDKTYLGSSIPKLFGGFGLTLYAGTNFRLGATFTYSYGNKRLWYMAAESTSQINNYNFSNKFAGQSAIINDPYTATYPNISIGSNGPSYMSDYWIFDASYIRLSSLNMSYRFGKQYFRNSLIENIEVTLQATNLFTLTKYPGFDPQGNFHEVSSSMTSNMGVDWSYYPASRSVNLGFKFTFK